MAMVKKKVSPSFEDILFDWDYETYLDIGGYGSGKSYNTVFKIILKCASEKRKVLVCREVYETMKDSCYDLFCEVLQDMNFFTDDPHAWRKKKNKVLGLKSPLQLKFPNGSTVIFRGMDSPDKVKSINGVSIVWLEECSEIKYAAYIELLGRIRIPGVSMHFLLTCNPVGRDNWVYRQFFTRLDDNGKETVIVPESKFYEKRTLVKNGVYYHHSTVDDNPWAPWQYIRRLDQLKDYDYPLYLVARWGRFGATGTRVLPQFSIAGSPKYFKEAIAKLGPENIYYGLDFGFEESYNALVGCAVDTEKSILYIFDEVYINHVTDDVFSQLPEVQRIKMRIKSYNNSGYQKAICADNEDPKAISYYRQNGFDMKKCKKWAGSRLSNTRKIKRFKKIICSPKCKNAIRELKDLTYKKDSKGNVIYDQFNIDPHTFSAIWYALDNVTVADLKVKEFNSKKGA